jgi:hypothetical protein
MDISGNVPNIIITYLPWLGNFSNHYSKVQRQGNAINNLVFAIRKAQKGNSKKEDAQNILKYEGLELCIYAQIQRSKKASYATT